MQACREKGTVRLAQTPRPAFAPQPAAGRLRNAVLRTARAMVWQSGGGQVCAGGSGADLALYANRRMLNDIGLDLDALRLDPSSPLWPH